MNYGPQIARLQQVDIRAAWAHETQDFTPWLYRNLDALSEAIGIRLEGEGAEVPVESFSADILARNQFDGTRVLIENQLECSDHTHLGQIMTYLAGLDAKTIVWVASSFREAHLSAVNWLNENTDESISFFAVQLKVVQIGGSPLAPIFDVVARPNNWERSLHAAVTPSGERSELSKRRFAFWQAFVDRVPGELERSGPPSFVSNRWLVTNDPPAIISYYLSNSGVGLFIRAQQGGSHEEMRDLLETKEDEIASRLKVPMSDSDKYFFPSEMKGNYNDEDQRDSLIDWLAEKLELYDHTLREVLGSGSGQI